MRDSALAASAVKPRASTSPARSRAIVSTSAKAGLKAAVAGFHAELVELQRVALVAADAEPLLVREHRLLEHLLFEARGALPHDGAPTLAEAHLIQEVLRAVDVCDGGTRWHAAGDVDGRVVHRRHLRTRRMAKISVTFAIIAQRFPLSSAPFTPRDVAEEET